MTLYFRFDIKCSNLGSFGVNSGQFWHTKIHRVNSMSLRGHYYSGFIQNVLFSCISFTLPEDRQSLVSYSFLSSFFFFFLLLLSSSGNTRFSHISLHPILTKLGHNDRYLDHYSGTKDGGVRGHHGVTGVKKVICTKKASSPSDYVALTRDLCICSSLTPSTKVMVLKNCQGSFGVTGVKSSFSQKRHQVLQIM